MCLFMGGSTVDLLFLCSCMWSMISGYELPVFVHGGSTVDINFLCLFIGCSKVDMNFLCLIMGGLNIWYEFPVFGHGASTVDMNFLCFSMGELNSGY